MIGTEREVEARKKDGSSFSCILGIAELKHNDGEQHYVGFIRDVTLQKRLLVAEAKQEASDNLLSENVTELKNQININDGILDACKNWTIFPRAFELIILLVFCILILNNIFSVQLLTRCLS